MAVTPGAATINLRNTLPLGVVTVGIHGGKRAGAAAGRPMAAADPVGNRDAFAPFDQRQNFCAAHPDGVDELHVLKTLTPPGFPGKMRVPLEPFYYQIDTAREVGCAAKARKTRLKVVSLPRRPLSALLPAIGPVRVSAYKGGDEFEFFGRRDPALFAAYPAR
jgi:hypothetical protein